MGGEWRTMSLQAAGVQVIDCDHKTPPAAETGYPYVGIPQLREGRLDVNDARRISRTDYLAWTRKAHPCPHDIVLSRRCNPGETAVVPTGLEFALGQNLVLLRSDNKKIDRAFLRWLVRSTSWWIQVRKYINVGAVFDSLRCSDIPGFEMQLPPLSEQRAIAHILGALDDKVELNRRMNETLEAMARALFQSWFVDFEPVRAKAEGRDPGLPKHLADLFPSRLVESDLGEIPGGWAVGKVADLCEAIFSGGTPSTANPEYWDGEIPWLSSGETREKFIIDTERRITADGVSGSSTRLASSGSTVIASAGQGNTRGQTSLLGFDCYINQSVVAVSADRETSSPCHLFLDLERRYSEFRRISDGHSSRGSLTTRLIAGLGAVLPPRLLIDRFDSFVVPLVDRVMNTRHESRTLTALRDTLLPKLISGELRVQDAERFLERAGL